MIVNEKLHKIYDSLQRAINNLEEGNKRSCVGDVHHIRENAEEIIWILEDQLEEEGGRR